MRLEKKSCWRLGYRCLRVRAMVPICDTSVNASEAVDGSDTLGCAFATFTHAICTCNSESPAGASQLSRMRLYSGLVGESHADAVCPPRAPLISTSVERFTAPSASAWPMNDHAAHGAVDAPEQNS